MTDDDVPGTSASAPWPADPTAMANGRAFVLDAARVEPVVLVPDGDADGLCAGVLMERTLAALGAPEPRYVLPAKGENVHASPFRERLAETGAARVIVLDTGSRAEPIAPGVPTLIVDHHQARGFPAGAVVVSAAGHPPVAPASLLTWELVHPLADLAPWEWLGVLGGVADLGEPERRADIEARYGKTNLREAISLLNAPRRAAAHDSEAALGVLRAATEPADIARGRVPGVDRLRAYRSEVQREVSVCGRAAPKFSGPVALIAIRSGAKVHPLLAQRWMRRLPKFVVIVANDGYLPGRVNFSVRSATGRDLIAFLRESAPDTGGDFAHGHTQATGGSLPKDVFDRFLEALGFDPAKIQATGGSTGRERDAPAP